MLHFPFIENENVLLHIELYLRKDIPCKDDSNNNIKYSDVAVMEYNKFTKRKQILGITRQYYTLDDVYISHSTFNNSDSDSDSEHCMKVMDITIEHLKDSLEKTWFEHDLIIEKPQQ